MHTRTHAHAHACAHRAYTNKLCSWFDGNRCAALHSGGCCAVLWTSCRGAYTCARVRLLVTRAFKDFLCGSDASDVCAARPALLVLLLVLVLGELAVVVELLLVLLRPFAPCLLLSLGLASVRLEPAQLDDAAQQIVRSVALCCHGPCRSTDIRRNLAFHTHLLWLKFGFTIHSTALGKLRNNPPEPLVPEDQAAYRGQEEGAGTFLRVTTDLGEINARFHLPLAHGILAWIWFRCAELLAALSFALAVGPVFALRIHELVTCTLRAPITHASEAVLAGIRRVLFASSLADKGEPRPI